MKMATKRYEQKLWNHELMLRHAITHLLNQHMDFLAEFHVVTEQDEIYYGPAMETASELLRDKMVEVRAEREHVHKEVHRRAMRLRRLQVKKDMTRYYREPRRAVIELRASA